MFASTKRLLLLQLYTYAPLCSCSFSHSAKLIVKTAHWKDCLFFTLYLRYKERHMLLMAYFILYSLLAKNGIYITLVKDVRDAFEGSDLVKIDCEGLNPSDYKKIGAKLRVLFTLMNFSVFISLLVVDGILYMPSFRPTQLNLLSSIYAGSCSLCSFII